MTDETLLSLIQRGQAVAAFLVAIGVAGEFVGDFVSRPIQRRIDAARQEELSQLQRASATATAAAANAQSSAARLEIEAMQQRKRAARAERDLLELQQRIAPRQLSERQRAAFVDSLKVGSKAPLSIVAAISDQEAVDWGNRSPAFSSRPDGPSLPRG